MLRELLSIFRPGNPLQAMADNFAKMIELTHKQTVKAGEIYFSRTTSPESRSEIRRMDVEVNKLERKIRKQVIQRLSLRGTTQQVPYSLLLMSLVKDVERIGDYAKNLSEVVDFSSDPLPDDEITAELHEFRKFVETAFGSTAEIFSESDREGAIELITAGRGLAQRSDALLSRIARSDYNASLTTSAILGTRYYKRIGAHLLNILSSVVMPLHKLDYYDESSTDIGGSSRSA